ncbi:MAG: transcriptional regulator BetI [Rhodobacterales bacterium]|nr:MAG: transcriptional regulator BetI [Rhodobacterales bacterium]
MPKLGMEPIRRAALVKATIEEIGAVRSLDVTVNAIARRAGVSSGLAHHYFGGKEDLLVAAMRHILTQYGAEVRAELARADTPRARLEGILAASFAKGNFQPDVIAAWLNFYVHAQSSPGAKRLLRIYHARLRSNLLHELKPIVGARAGEVAEMLAAQIDGYYIRLALSETEAAPLAVTRMRAALDHIIRTYA